MTLDEFRATGRNVDDLEAIVPGMDLHGRAGRVYTNHHLWIERWDDDRHGKAPPRGPTWLLTLHSQQIDGQLPTLEDELFQWAVDEEILCGEKHIGRDTGRGVCSNCQAAL